LVIINSQLGRNIKPIGQLRTFDEFAEQYFRDRPEEVDDYLAEIFQEYAEDKDNRALLASLNILARIQGIRVIN
jgi:HTH-type transcriptional regulator / antitoxin HigA